jgi:predicted RNase H-like nuclease (RuvC/YqgF family)
MAAQQPPDDRSDLDAEHEALKKQTAALRRDHERLHTQGGSKAEHQEHVRNLRLKIKELEAHVQRLKNERKSR